MRRTEGRARVGGRGRAPEGQKVVYPRAVISNPFLPTPFLLSFPDELGDVGPVNLKWEFDRHITDLLNPVTACLPIFCSDGLFVDRVQFSADQHCNQEE